MRTMLKVVSIILCLIATTVFADERLHRQPIPVEVVKQPFRLIGGNSILDLQRECRIELIPAIPSGKVFVADYVSISVRVAGAPADLEGSAYAFTGFVSFELVPSLGKLERVGDHFVLGKQASFLMIPPTEDARPIGLVAEFTAQFPEPVDVSCNGRIDGHLIDAHIDSQVP